MYFATSLLTTGHNLSEIQPMTATAASGHFDSSETSKKAFAAPELVAAACARALAAEKRSKSQTAVLKPQNQGQLPLF